MHSVELQCGPYSLRFEPATGMVRYLRCGESEVLRGVYAAVRDHNWDTIEPALRDLRIDQDNDALRIAFHADCRRDEVEFAWQGEIVVTPEGSFSYRFMGRAASTFRRNRIGFCVLHASECAGAACEIELVDGNSAVGEFPRLISPHQPFKNMRAITHPVANGLRAEVRMEGDVFEMEDQRNWSDASFKTYCTPLELPFPVEIAEGTVIQQQVSVKLLGSELPATRGPKLSSAESVAIMIADEVVARCPPIGLSVVSHEMPLSEGQLKRLVELRPAHLRVDLHLSDGDCERRLARAVSQTKRLDSGLELALFVTGNAEEQLCLFARQLAQHAPRIARVLMFHEREKTTPPELVALAKRQLREAIGQEAAVGGGTNMYFTELNRGRPDTSEWDVVCYSLNPQVHAFDVHSLIETLSIQGETVRAARSFCAGTPIAVSPITLRPRFNPNATDSGGANAGADHEKPDPAADPRQATAFAAAWTLGSIASLAAADVGSLTYYETTGSRGVMPDASRSTSSAARGGVEDAYPLFHVLTDATRLRGWQVLRTTCGDAWRVAGVAARDEREAVLLLANLTAAPLTVTLEGSLGKAAAASRRFTLRPHQYQRITWTP